MTWRRYNWPKDVILPMLLALLRASWLLPWLELARRSLASSSTAAILPLPLLLSVYLASVALARLALGRVRSMALARLAQTLAGFAAILLALWWRFYHGQYLPWDVQWLRDMATVITQTENEFPAPLLAIPVIIYLWLRGILDGRGALYRDDVWNAFIVGFLSLASAALVSRLDGRGLPAGMSSLVFAFFAIGMAALALASLETEQRLAAHSGDGQLSLNRYWLASVVSVVVVLLALGLLLSALITPEFIARALQWTSLVFGLIGRVLYYVVLVIAYIIFSLLEPLLAAFDRAQRSSAPAEQTPTPDYQQQLQDLPKGAASLPPQISALLPWLGLGVVILLVALAFAVALRRMKRDSADDVAETREIILSRDLLAQQLARLWQNILRRGRGAGAGPASLFLALDGEPDTRRTIRQIYQAFLSAMRERGHARLRGQTPSEYRDAMQMATPSAHAALGAVTDAYQQARYSAQAPDTAQARSAQQAWEEIEKSLKPKEAE